MKDGDSERAGVRTIGEKQPGRPLSDEVLMLRTTAEGTGDTWNEEGGT